MEIGRLEAEGSGRLGDVAHGLLERFANDLPFAARDESVEALILDRLTCFEQRLGKILRQDRALGSEHDGAFDGVRQLPDVARPVVVEKKLARIGRDALDVALAAGRGWACEAAGVPAGRRSFDWANAGWPTTVRVRRMRAVNTMRSLDCMLST